jgi:hypothetical protein
MRINLVVLISFVFLFQYGSVHPLAADTVARVVVVQTDNADAYVKELERGKSILERLQSPGKIRVWRARFAGNAAGSVIVTVEYPSLAAIADDDAKDAKDPEFQTWLKGLDKIRKIVSDSLYTELKP